MPIYDAHPLAGSLSMDVESFLLKKLVDTVLQSHGRNAHIRFIIIDAPRVKHTDTAEQKGYDAGK